MLQSLSPKLRIVLKILKSRMARENREVENVESFLIFKPEIPFFWGEGGGHLSNVSSTKGRKTHCKEKANM